MHFKLLNALNLKYLVNLFYFIFSVLLQDTPTVL